MAVVPVVLLDQLAQLALLDQLDLVNLVPLVLLVMVQLDQLDQLEMVRLVHLKIPLSFRKYFYTYGNSNLSIVVRTQKRRCNKIPNTNRKSAVFTKDIL